MTKGYLTVAGFLGMAWSAAVIWTFGNIILNALDQSLFRGIALSLPLGFIMILTVALTIALWEERNEAEEQPD